MNKKDVFIKTIILLVAVIFVFAAWYGFTITDKKSSKIEELKTEIEKQKKQIGFLKNSNDTKTKIIRKTDVERIQETSNMFVQSVFNIKLDNYKERKSNGKTVLTQSLFQKNFTGEPKQLEYEYSLEEINVYVDQTSDKQASAYITFEQAVTNINNDETNKSYMTVQVFLQKEGKSWIVNEFKQINAEPL